jgi:hypothetical protein
MQACLLRNAANPSTRYSTMCRAGAGRVMGTTGKSSKHVAPQVKVGCRGRSQEAR